MYPAIIISEWHITCLVKHSLYPHLLYSLPVVLADAAFFLAILLYSLVRPIHLAAWWYPIIFYIQVRMHVHRSGLHVIAYIMTLCGCLPLNMLP